MLRRCAAPSALLLALLVLITWADGAIEARTPAVASPAGAVPPPGGWASTISHTDDVQRLLESIPFEARTLLLFDVPRQHWIWYSPVSPAWLNEEFVATLDVDDPVWLLRSRDDARGGVAWSASTEQAIVTGPRTLPVPPPGGMTVGVTGTSSLQEFIDAQSFRVSTVWAFDVERQEYLAYDPGRPAWVNSIGADGLHPTGIVWVVRHRDDVVSAAPTGGTGIAPAPQSGAGSPTPTPATATTPTATGTPTATQSPNASPSTAVSGAVGMVRHLTYEAGEREMTSDQAPSGGLGRTGESARVGIASGFAHLRDDAPRSSAGGYRAEWHGDDHVGRGTERWYGISYFFPSDYDQGNNSQTWDDRIIFQFADQGSPMFSLHLDADSQELWVRRKLPERDSSGRPQFRTLARWSIDTERWYDMVFHARWETDGSGTFEVYLDGKQIVDFDGRTLAERDVTYSKWGIYGQPTRLLFDEVWTASGSGTMSPAQP